MKLQMGNKGQQMTQLDLTPILPLLCSALLCSAAAANHSSNLHQSFPVQSQRHHFNNYAALLSTPTMFHTSSRIST
jgi:hypothetical protein